jgi:hypothetical protein
MTQPASSKPHDRSISRLHGGVTPQRGIPAYPKICFGNHLSSPTMC